MKRIIRSLGVVSLVVSGSLLASRQARAEVTIGTGHGWEVFTDGHVGAFFGYANGDGFPRPRVDKNNDVVTFQGGGLPDSDGIAAIDSDDPTDQGKVANMRVRTGFVGNTIGIGARRKMTNDGTILQGYFSLWSFIESESKRKYRPNPVDVREGYLRLSGPWGSFLAGRSFTLFSRGATEITYLYGFKYGLGYPGTLEFNGPTNGHIGFGVLANGFAAGFVYTSPVLAGFQLTVGAFDPSSLGGLYERTQLVRPEAELTYELKLGQSGIIKVFGNGAWQKIYDGNDGPEATAAGAGYGARIEVGPVHLGLAGHYGKGLGLNYALESSATSVATGDEQNQELRTSDGLYAQAQVLLGKTFSIQAGLGVTNVRLLDTDKVDNRDNDGNALTPVANDDPDPQTPDPLGDNLIKRQLGTSFGVTYHCTDYLHLSADYFRADFKWYQGDKQVVNFLNAGITADW